jgi:hypothetical protein
LECRLFKRASEDYCHLAYGKEGSGAPFVGST